MAFQGHLNNSSNARDKGASQARKALRGFGASQALAQDMVSAGGFALETVVTGGATKIAGKSLTISKGAVPKHLPVPSSSITAPKPIACGIATSRPVQEAKKTVRSTPPANLPVTYVSQEETGIVWGKGIQGQGLTLENYVARQMPAKSRLPQNYETFDFHDRPTEWAVSVKTLDTTTPSRITKPERIYHKMKRDIDAAANFKEHRLSGKKLTSNLINQREIHLAVPAQTTSAQWEQVSRAVQYGETQGVKVKITAVVPE